MNPEVATPVKRIQISFTGGAEPLPYGSSHVVGLNSESCRGSLLRELSPQATEGVKFIKVKGRLCSAKPSFCQLFMSAHTGAHTGFLSSTVSSTCMPQRVASSSAFASAAGSATADGLCASEPITALHPTPAAMRQKRSSG